MKVYQNLLEVGSIRNPVVTTGIFDGVHIGHKAIIERLKKFAAEIHGETVIITFYPHPRTILYPETHGKNLKFIYSQAEKIKLLDDLGIDHLIIISFTREFAATSSQQFVKQIIIDKLHAKKVVVGFNHHFGYMKTGNYAFLQHMGQESGFEVEEIPSQELENETISSTRVRNALNKGNIQKANAYLDRFYFIMGCLKEGDSKYSKIGFPMYRILPEEDSKLIPPSGIYAISSKFEDRNLRGMLKIETQLLENKKPTIEIHFFNANDLKLLEQTLSVNIHMKVRNRINSTSLLKLRSQLLKDQKKIEELIF
jgi:riboflavin kinase / FMN adenylyltransferase